MADEVTSREHGPESGRPQDFNDLNERLPKVPPEAGAQSTENLLKAFAALTHRIHAAEAEGRLVTATDLRAQRDIIKREILRRCGEL